MRHLGHGRSVEMWRWMQGAYEVGAIMVNVLKK